MAEEEFVEKTDLEKSRDIITQLKEMEHYAKSNIEMLTEHWLKMDGELKQKDMASKLEALLTQQNSFRDNLERAMTDYEALCQGMESKA